MLRSYFYFESRINMKVRIGMAFFAMATFTPSIQASETYSTLLNNALSCAGWNVERANPMHLAQDVNRIPLDDREGHLEDSIYGRLGAEFLTHFKDVSIPLTEDDYSENYELQFKAKATSSIIQGVTLVDNYGYGNLMIVQMNGDLEQIKQTLQADFKTKFELFNAKKIKQENDRGNLIGSTGNIWQGETALPVKKMYIQRQTSHEGFKYEIQLYPHPIQARTVYLTCGIGPVY